MGLRPLDLRELQGVYKPGACTAKEQWELQNFQFAYRRQPTVLNIERAVFGAGKVTAVIGRNGAGKSTLLRCLCGLERRGKGRVKTSLGVWDRKDRLKFCYMVMQDVNHQLFTESVLDEVLLSMPRRTQSRRRRF